MKNLLFNELNSLKDLQFKDCFFFLQFCENLSNLIEKYFKIKGKFLSSF